VSETICMASEKTDKWRGSCLIWRRISCHNIRATYSLLVQCWAALKPMIVIISLILYFLLDVFPFAATLNAPLLTLRSLQNKYCCRACVYILELNLPLKLKPESIEKYLITKRGELFIFGIAFRFLNNLLSRLFFLHLCVNYTCLWWKINTNLEHKFPTRSNINDKIKLISGQTGGGRKWRALNIRFSLHKDTQVILNDTEQWPRLSKQIPRIDFKTSCSNTVQRFSCWNWGILSIIVFDVS
jgi:hypothetical protein